MISVIIPAYNASAFLRDTLLSVQRQTLEDFEVLVVDDGSTDDTADIAGELCSADSRFHLIRRSNGGLSAARNTGIENMRGLWVTFLDADDLLCPEALDTMLRAVREGKTRWCIGGFVEWDGDDPTAYLTPDQTRSDITGLTLLSTDITIRESLYQSLWINSAWGKLIDASLFIGKEGLRFAEGMYYEDLEIFHRLADAAGPVTYLSTPLYLYRQHAASFLHTFSPQRLDVLTVTDSIVEYCRLKHPTLVPAALDRRFSANFNMLLLLESARPEGYDEVADKCWRTICQGRWQALRDPKVRLKNKLGALLTLTGRAGIRMSISISRAFSK